MHHASLHHWAVLSRATDPSDPVAPRTATTRAYYSIELVYPALGPVVALLGADESEQTVDYDGLLWSRGKVLCELAGTFSLAATSVQRGLEAAVVRALRAMHAGATTLDGQPAEVTVVKHG